MKEKQHKSYKPILCVDFDGVIHSYTSGWQGATEIPDLPVPGAFEALTEYTEYYDVCIYSSRSKDPGFFVAAANWFLKHGLDPDIFKRLQFPKDKPAAFLTIDDRAWCFNGTWPTIPMIANFKPWDKL